MLAGCQRNTILTKRDLEIGSQTKLSSVSNGKTLYFSVTCKVHQETNLPVANWRKDFGASIWPVSAPLSTKVSLTLLDLYALDQTLRYLDTGTTAPTVTVRCVLGGATFDEARANPTDWFLDLGEPVEYCQNTMALRSGTNIIDVLPNRQNLSRNWVPFNRASYSNWWSQVNGELKLDEKFGRKYSNSTP